MGKTPVSNSASFTFSDDGGKFFREPTLLYRNDAPFDPQTSTGPDIHSDSISAAGPFTDAYLKDANNNPMQYYGILIGKMPAAYTGTVDMTKYKSDPPNKDNNFICTTYQAGTGQTTPAGASYPQYTFRLEYQDPNDPTNWLIYD